MFWKTKSPALTDEAKLIARFRRGDTDAFNTLFDRYGERVLRFCIQLTGCRADAEDLTQETFLATLDARERFAGQSRFLTYLLAIAVRRNRDNRRKKQVATVTLWEEQDTLSPSAPFLPTSPDVATGVLSQIAYKQALGALDAPLREAFLLVSVEGLLHREAAAVLGIPLGTAKWRVAEATRRLRSTLENHDE